MQNVWSVQKVVGVKPEVDSQYRKQLWYCRKRPVFPVMLICVPRRGRPGHPSIFQRDRLAAGRRCSGPALRADRRVSGVPTPITLSVVKYQDCSCTGAGDREDPVASEPSAGEDGDTAATSDGLAGRATSAATQQRPAGHCRPRRRRPRRPSVRTLVVYHVYEYLMHRLQTHNKYQLSQMKPCCRPTQRWAVSVITDRRPSQVLNEYFYSQQQVQKERKTIQELGLYNRRIQIQEKRNKSHDRQ